MIIFDRSQLLKQRQRAATSFASHNVLFQETTDLLVERIQDVKREFTSILELGTHQGLLQQSLGSQPSVFVSSDYSFNMLRDQHGAILTSSVVCDEEFLPFADNSFDLIVSNLTLHWVNDLPGSLVQIKRALSGDGLLLATMLGGDTLMELRSCLVDAELAIMGGISPRLSPTLTLQATSDLLQRTGFHVPVVDQETFTLVYPDAFALMRDVRGMGQTNAHQHRLRTPTRRTVLMEAARLYQQRFPHPEGGITARFDILFLHGWKTAPQ